MVQDAVDGKNRAVRSLTTQVVDSADQGWARAQRKLRARGRSILGAKSTAISLYSYVLLLFPGYLQRRHMEHTRAPPDLGRKSPGTVPAPALRGVSWRKGAAASSSPTGRGSGSPADLFPDGHGSGSPADLFPGRRGSRSVASLFPIGDGNSAASGFTSHGGVGTSSSTRGIPFPASSSPACWDSTGASPMSPPFRHSGSLDPTW